MSSSSSTSPSPEQHGSRRTVRDYRQAKLNHPRASVRFNPYPSTPGSEHYLDAFGSTKVIDGLAQNSPLGLAPLAEPVQLTRLADLSSDGLSTMIMSTRAARSAHLHELETMKIQIIEKKKQIALLEDLVKSRSRCIEDTEASLSDLEEYARYRNIDVNAFAREQAREDAARRNRKLRGEALLDEDDLLQTEDVGAEDVGDESDGSSDALSDDTARPARARSAQSRRP